MSNPPEKIQPKLIVGLGNPEPKYDNTRHNIGFKAIDELAKDWQTTLSENKRFRGLLGESYPIPGHKIILLKPSTYMNRSGQSVRAVTDWFKLPPASVLVIYDDMDLPIGRIRLRLSGSAGGHNGMKSIISHLGTQDFPRLRIGIGASQKAEVVSHVLGKFSLAETKVMETVLQEVQDAVQLSLNKGIEQSMNRYNSRVIESVQS